MRQLLLPRRAFLQALGGLSFVPALAWSAEPSPPELILREREPQNLEYPFWSLNQPITANEQFYVRNHFAMPALDVSAWRLKVEGAVVRPLEFDYTALRKLPTESRMATLECAGNGRVHLTPTERGVQWDQGAVGTAEWTGVPLKTLLDRASVRPEAVEIVLEGADAGEVRSDPKSPGLIPFARSLPLAKATAPEVLLAHTMNGVDLPRAHGFPFRAVVPGWYGMASIKWLTRIVVVERPFQGFHQTLDYTIWERVNGLPTLKPITELQLKAAIAQPARGAVLKPGTRCAIRGAAWTGESEITKVDVSTDGGQMWNAAQLTTKPIRYTWTLWSYEWAVPAKPGRCLLMARAADARSQTQPMTRDPDRRNYMINHVLPVEVEVR